MKKILWLLLLVVVAVMAFYGAQLKHMFPGGPGIVTLEFADKYSGLLILDHWNSIIYGTGSLLNVAQTHTHWDFVFILLYVTLLIMHSNSQMQREKWVPLNELLRLNIFLAIIAGLLDIGENVILLHNFHHVNEPAFYWESYAFTLPKFLLAGWMVLIWLTSIVKSGLAPRHGALAGTISGDG